MLFRPVIHVIDDDAAMRDSLAFVLDARGFEPRLHESGQAFLDGSWVRHDSCVLTDVRMPGVNGLMLIRRMAERGPAPPVIVMTGHADVPLAVEAVRAGALDVLEKPFDDNRLFEAIALALAAGRAPSDLVGVDRLIGLSGREREVLHGVAAGKSNKTIALELGISPRTVEVYRAKLMAKADVHTLADLMRIAVSAGF